MYRLSVFPIEVAPLRQRPEDILLLAELTLQRTVRKYGRQPLALTQADLLKLESYDWPGKVRELQNVLERAMIVSKDRLRLDLEVPATAAVPPAKVDRAEGPKKILTEVQLRSQERRNLETALRLCSGRIYGPEGAAQLLGLPPTTLNCPHQEDAPAKRR